MVEPPGTGTSPGATDPGRRLDPDSRNPGTTTKARVIVAVLPDSTLSDKQLLALSRSGAAQIVQVVLPKDDCKLQEQALQNALPQLNGPATLVSGIGPGAALAWRWIASQSDDKAQAVSVGFTINPAPGCTDPLPKTLAHGHWLVAWNDNPDDESAGFVRDTPTPPPASATTISTCHKY